MSIESASGTGQSLNKNPKHFGCFAQESHDPRLSLMDDEAPHEATSDRWLQLICNGDQQAARQVGCTLTGKKLVETKATEHQFRVHFFVRQRNVTSSTFLDEVTGPGGIGLIHASSNLNGRGVATDSRLSLCDAVKPNGTQVNVNSALQEHA